MVGLSVLFCHRYKTKHFHYVCLWSGQNERFAQSIMTNKATLLLPFLECDQRIYYAFSLTHKRFEYLSPFFDSFFGLDQNQIRPDQLFAMIHPDDRTFLRASYLQLKPGRLKRDLEFRITLPDKKEYTLRFHMLLEESEISGRMLTGYAEDITAFKLHNQTAKDLTNKKNAILNILSHDLTGPLGSIQHFTYVLNKKTKSLNDAQLETIISSIEKISKRSIQMIQEFIKMEFIESVGVDLIKERVNLVETLQPFLSEYQTSPNRIKKTFLFEPTTPHIYVEIDQNKFMQVINNLISNAIKFTHDGGTILLRVHEKNDKVLITITDDGIGIPEKFHPTLFEKFSNARRTGLKGEPSVGLGMSIIKTIVEWHRGKIWFESEENVGTTFYIEIDRSLL